MVEQITLQLRLNRIPVIAQVNSASSATIFLLTHIIPQFDDQIHLPFYSCLFRQNMIYYIHLLRLKVTQRTVFPGGYNMSNNTKTQKQDKRQQEDAIFNRILILFCCAVVAEVIFLLINHFLPGFAAIRWLTILIPVAAVLALVYYLFQRDFFCITLICAGGISSLQLYRRMFIAHPFRIRCGFVLGFVLLAAAVVVLILLQRNDGALPKGTRFLPKDTNYPLLYITCVVNAVLLALTLILGGTAAYYLLFVLVGWLFIMAVYYTVKLM